MSAATLAIVYGLLSALTWGAGDFSGGVAARRVDLYRVVWYAHLIGLLLFVLLATTLQEQMPTAIDLGWGALAGLAGMVGVLAFYRSLSAGNMGVSAPVAAVVTAIIPIVVGIVTEGAPPVTAIGGFLLALLAVWLLAGGGSATTVGWRALALPALAGVGFALFLVLISRVRDGSVFWPLTAARAASSTFLTLFILLRSRRGSASPRRSRRDMASMLAVVGAGLFDAGGNAFFALAAQVGRLDVASVLSSLYPASTVLLAHLLLGERLSSRQTAGVVLALVALVLITL